MEVYLKNIQGFKGEFYFTVEGDITHIAAKLNGTGKTTFFECLKLLCLPELFDSEDLLYILNKDCHECLFSITLQDVLYGFKYDRRRLQYFRQYEGEQLESCYRPFPEAAEKLDIYIKNGTPINVCDRFINLFSSSNESLNFNLVQALISHQQLEQNLKLLEEAIAISKQHAESFKQEAQFYHRELANAKHFQNLDELEIILEESQIFDLYNLMVLIANDVSLLLPTTDAVAVQLIESLNYLLREIENFIPTSQLIKLEDLDMVKELLTIRAYIERISIVKPQVNIELFESLADLQALTDSLVITNCWDLIIDLAEVLEAFTQYSVSTTVESPDMLLSLTELLNDVSSYERNIRDANECKMVVAELKTQLAPYRHKCDLHEEVYLVDGRCFNV